MLESDFWQNKSFSQKIIKEKKFYEDLINSYNYSVKTLNELHDLNELALEEKNQSIINEVIESIKNLKKSAKKNETKCFLSKETDSMDGYIEIHAGAGVTERSPTEKRFPEKFTGSPDQLRRTISIPSSTKLGR